MNDTATEPTADQIAAATDKLTKELIATAIVEYLDRHEGYMLDTYREGEEIVKRMRRTAGAYNQASRGETDGVADFVERGATSFTDGR